MKPLKLSYRSLAIAVAAIPFVGLSAQTLDTTSDRTPGAEALADSEAQIVTPYAAPADVFVPESSKAVAAAAGQWAHTNYVIRKPDSMLGAQPKAISDLTWPEPAADPVPGATTPEYPASLACIYKMGPAYAGCVPTNNAAYNATGGVGPIAIVIAFRNPTVLTDLQYFSSYFGLPAPLFTLVNVTYPTYPGASCSSIPTNAGWALESALDTQWAHAMAPNARIILVQACDNSYAQLKLAESVAAQKLLPYGGGQVSNSWGSGEWSTESADFDDVFRFNWEPGKPISYFFSAGDSGLGAEYPSSSPWVISVGGTTINRDPSTLAFQSESCWAGSGGGTSAYETYGTVFGTGTGPWTNFQYPLFGQSNRRTPDISFDADPASGAWVRYNGGWYVVGGTSLSAPAVAGIVNNARNRLGVAPIDGGYYTSAENNLLYAQLLTQKEYKANFYDVTTGSNGAAATVGWDYCTGVGSPRGRLGK